MNKAQVLLSLLGACVGTIVTLCVLWYLAPFLIAIIGIIGFFMAIGYFVEKSKSGE